MGRARWNRKTGLALVTGGGGGIGGGIGAGIAAALHEQGARVILADLDEGHLAKVAADLGDPVATLCLDVTDRADWTAARP